MLFQTNYSGRAEFGTTGDDDFHLKVSADGAAWNEAVVADKDTGAVRFPAGIEHPAALLPLHAVLATPGGDGVVSVYRNDVARSQNPRAAAISSVASDVITLTTADADLFFDDPRMNGVSYIRIWNTSKAPEESGWVIAVPDWGAGDTQLQVTDAAHVSGWANGETIQVGDPAGVHSTRVMALDISPMMQAVLGAVFPQAGIIAKVFIQANVAGHAIFRVSPDATPGSFLTNYAFSDGTFNPGQVMVPCTELSPISNSNLVFIREDDLGAGTLSSAALSVNAVVA